MNENKEQNEQRHEARRRKGHGFWSGLLIGGLLGGLLAAGVAASTGSAKAAGRFLAAAGHGQHARFTDPEMAREKADFAIEWILGRVDGTDAQIEQVKGLVGGSLDEVWPLAELHRSNRTVLVTELTQPTIDRNAIEEIRKSELELADQVSNRLINTLVDVAEVLTPEQRNELIEQAQRFHR